GGVSRRDSANHLVRLEEERRGNGEPQGLRGFEVDDQFVLRRLLHGEVGGVSALQYLVYDSRGTTIHLGGGRPIREQATSFREGPPSPYHRHPVVERKAGNLPSRLVRKRTRRVERIDRVRVRPDRGEDPLREFLTPLHIEESERQA